MATPQALLSLLDIVNRCDSFPYALSSNPKDHAVAKSFLDFMVDGIPLGRIHSRLVPHLVAFNQDRPTFHITDASVSFMTWINNFESRSNAIADLLNIWRKDLVNFPCLIGWRNELYGVFSNKVDPSLSKHGAALAIERSACGLFGIHASGIHMNGYVKTGPRPSDVQMWIARRSKTKPTYPGMLDNMVAGGLGFGHSPAYTAIKESMEEASLPPHIAELAYPVGTISYIKISKDGLETQPETQIVYDLKLPKEVIPRPCDTEVEDFRLWTMPEVLAAIRRGEFKPNCACVALHFMVRHAVLTPENEPDYLQIVQRLQRQIEFPGPRIWPTFNEQH